MRFKSHLYMIIFLVKYLLINTPSNFSIVLIEGILVLYAAIKTSSIPSLYNLSVINFKAERT